MLIQGQYRLTFISERALDLKNVICIDTALDGSNKVVVTRIRYASETNRTPLTIPSTVDGHNAFLLEIEARCKELGYNNFTGNSEANKPTMVTTTEEPAINLNISDAETSKHTEDS